MFSPFNTRAKSRVSPFLNKSLIIIKGPHCEVEIWGVYYQKHRVVYY